MQLYLYNSLSKKKELFIPLDSNKIGMYVCGPTVYDYPHIGNALAVVIYDVLFRLLKKIYGEKNVIYIRNITDVDDKIINSAIAQKISINELTSKITNIFQENMAELNCLSPTIEPKATQHIPEMIEMIERLISNEYAYVSNGHVYFRVHKFAQYGDLSGRHLKDLVVGARVEVSEDKENPEDFVLWKPAKDVDHCFDSPFGLGRPGWHIECSAMSHKYLGDSFDIHGGGVDLIFPHHSNEIAQSCCAYPNSKYAKYWIHNGFLTVNGEKMSKSLGNFVTTSDILDKGISGEVIRYILLNSHYRKPIDWNDKALNDAKKALDSFYRVLQKLDIDDGEIPQEFYNTLLDDLNTPQSFAMLHEYVHEFNKTNNPRLAAKLKACGKLLGFFESNPDSWFKDSSVDAKYIEEQILKRSEAKAQKNWQEADFIRDSLKDKGVILEDLPGGKCIWRKS